MATNTITGNLSSTSAIKSESEIPEVASPKQTLPSYMALVLAASTPVVFCMIASLALGHVNISIGLAGGLVIAVVMYSGIYSFVNGASSMILSSVGGKANGDSKQFMPIFAVVAVLKFVALGALLYILFRVLHIGMVAFAVGFIAAQISVTLLCVRGLMSSPLIDKSRRK